MAAALRIAVVGVVALGALAQAAGAVASGPGPASAAVGFQPVPLSVAADGAGHVYLSNPQRSRQIRQYSSDGDPLASWGDFATSSSPLQPRPIATDAAGNVYVVDSGRDQVAVLGPDGRALSGWSAEGRDIAVGAGGVYLAGFRQVQRFAADGALLSSWGTSGYGDGQFAEIWGLDTSPSGLVYVADTYASRIQVFSAAGAFVAKWGGYGKAAGQFIFPYGIATSASGDVYVADTGNARIQRFSASGAFLGAWGGPGGRPGRFFTPTSVATDPAGYVYVADAGEPYPDLGAARVQKFTADGRFLTQWRESPPRSSPPRPRLAATVGARTKKRFATFRFHSMQDRARFQCRLSGQRVPRKLRRWRRCNSPKRYTHLRPGRKTFHVRAFSDTSASKPARRSWRIVA